MATKKQVRARVAAQREAFEAEYLRTGLEAQRKDIQKREARKAQREADAAAEAAKKEQKLNAAKKAVADAQRETQEELDSSATEQECI